MKYNHFLIILYPFTRNVIAQSTFEIMISKLRSFMRKITYPKPLQLHLKLNGCKLSTKSMRLLCSSISLHVQRCTHATTNFWLPTNPIQIFSCSFMQILEIWYKPNFRQKKSQNRNVGVCDSKSTLHTLEILKRSNPVESQPTDVCQHAIVASRKEKHPLLCNPSKSGAMEEHDSAASQSSHRLMLLLFLSGQSYISGSILCWITMNEPVGVN